MASAQLVLQESFRLRPKRQTEWRRRRLRLRSSERGRENGLDGRRERGGGGGGGGEGGIRLGTAAGASAVDGGGGERLFKHASVTARGAPAPAPTAHLPLHLPPSLPSFPHYTTLLHTPPRRWRWRRYVKRVIRIPYLCTYEREKGEVRPRRETRGRTEDVRTDRGTGGRRKQQNSSCDCVGLPGPGPPSPRLAHAMKCSFSAASTTTIDCLPRVRKCGRWHRGGTSRRSGRLRPRGAPPLDPSARPTAE